MATSNQKPWKSWSERLRHPLWQKKRLEIMQRADFKCENCGSGEQTLNVHHGFYQKGAQPWEYENETLHCYCEKCHLTAHALLDTIQEKIATWNLDDLEMLSFYEAESVRIPPIGFAELDCYYATRPREDKIEMLRCLTAALTYESEVLLKFVQEIRDRNLLKEEGFKEFLETFK